MKKNLCVIVALLVLTSLAAQAQPRRVYSLCSYVGCSASQQNLLSKVLKRSNLQAFQPIEIIEPKNYHLSLFVALAEQEAWRAELPIMLQKNVEDVIKAHPIAMKCDTIKLLRGREDAVVVAALDNKPFKQLKDALISMLYQRYPGLGALFVGEYVPHISLAYIKNKAEAVGYNQRELNFTAQHLNGRKLVHPEFSLHLEVNHNAPTNISVYTMQKE